MRLCTPGPVFRQRLDAGIPQQDAKSLLDKLVNGRPKTPHGWFSPGNDKRQMSRIQEDMAESLPSSVDRELTQRFAAWALETTRGQGAFQTSVCNALASVQKAVDFTHPAEWFPVA